MRRKKFQSILVYCQCGLRGTLRVKPLTWGHGPNFGSPRIWVVTAWYQSQGCNNTLGSVLMSVRVYCYVYDFLLCLVNELVIN